MAFLFRGMSSWLQVGLLAVLFLLVFTPAFGQGTTSECDLAIQKVGDSTWTGVGAYNTDNNTVTTQVATAQVTAGTRVTFNIQISNASTTDKTFNIRAGAGAAGWTVTYADAPTNGADITGQVTAMTGWQTPLIAAGTSKEIAVTVTSTNTNGGYASFVSVSPTNNSTTMLDRVGFGMQIQGSGQTGTARPDLALKKSKDTIYTGQYVFNTKANDTTYTTQRVSQPLSAGKAVYHVKLGNSGTGAGTFRLVAASSDPEWTLKVYDALVGGTEVTKDITGKDGWEVKDLATGTAKELLLEVTPNGDKAGTATDITIYVVPGGTAVAQDNRADQVIAEATLGGSTGKQELCNLMVKLPDDKVWFAEDLYGVGSSYWTLPARQVEPKSIMYVRVRNDHTTSGKFLFCEENAVQWTPADWGGPATKVKVTVYDAFTGGKEITADVEKYVDPGFDLGTMKPGEVRDFRIEIDNPELEAGKMHVHINTNLPGGGTEDCLHFTFVYEELKSYQPDLVWISDDGEVWKDVYDNNTGQQTIETEQQLTVADTYRFCVHNYKSKKAAIYKFNASAADEGWTVKYYDEGKDITAQANSPEGYTLPSISAGGFHPGLRVTVTPAETLPVGTQTRLGLLLRSTVGQARQDDGAIVITTTPKPVLPTYQADLLIRASEEDPFLGDHVYNNVATQTAYLATSRNAPAVYTVILHNVGTGTDPMRVTGTALPDGWTVAYYDAWDGGNDITAAVTGEGWTSRSLEPFGRVYLRVEVTPDLTIAWGDKQAITLTATSTMDDAKADAVVASTTCANLPISRVRLRVAPTARIQVNHEVTLTATPVGGRLVQYCFFVYDGAGWRLIRDYDWARTCTWMPTKAGKYALLVWAKEKGSGAQYDVNATIWQYEVTPTVTGVVLTASPSSQGTVAAPVTLTAAPVGGSDLVYAFALKEADGTLTPLRPFAPSPTFVWTPTAAGRFTFVVQAKTSDSLATVEATGTLNGYTVNAAAAP